jgi:hypothetical protein
MNTNFQLQGTGMDSFSALTETENSLVGNNEDILIDEIHKVFQMIDGGKGYLEVSEILDLQANIAESKTIHKSHSYRGGRQTEQG